MTRVAFGTGCEPYVDWSLCEEDTGFPAVLPAVYIVSAMLYASTGVLYSVSVVRTVRTQLRAKKKKLSFNTAMQMHVGIVTYSVAGFIHAVSLVSQEPRLPALPLLLLLHLRYICVGYVTTVLVRHWAVLYQQMGKSQPSQGQLTERMERIAKMYREGEVIQAILTCSFFFGTVIYGVNHQENWHRVERLQHLVWAIFSGGTGWLVTFLGHRVHSNMKNVARSSVVLDYLRRVKYVVVGSSFLWCQSTGWFTLGAVLGRPLSSSMWLILHGGTDLTSIGTGFLYYVVIGSKIADKAATAAAVDAAHLPAEGVKQVQQKFQALARLVSSGANQIIEGVSTIASIGETSARVHMGENGEEPASYRRIASGRLWPVLGRIDTGAPASESVSMGMAGSREGPETRTKAGAPPGEGDGRTIALEMAVSSETKVQMPDGVDEEVGVLNELTFDSVSSSSSSSSSGGGGRAEGARKEENQNEGNEATWETPVSPMMASNTRSTSSSVSGGVHDKERGNGGIDVDDEDDDAHCSEESSGGQRQQQRVANPGRRRKRSSARRPSSDDSSRPSGEPLGEQEETWRVEDLEADSSCSSSCDDGSHDGRHADGGGSQSDHGSHTGTHEDWTEEEQQEQEEEEKGHHHSEGERETHSYHSDRSHSHHSDELDHSESHSHHSWSSSGNTTLSESR